MPVWKLESKRAPSPVQSSWKPQGAGAPNLRCEFFDPPADRTGAVGTDGTLRIHAEVAAFYDRNRRREKDGLGVVPHAGQGITLARAALRRNADVWMSGAGWVRMDPMMAVRHQSVPLSFSSAVSDFGVRSIIAEGEIAADELGPGPLIVQIYLEGHPREPVWHRTRGWDPAVAGTFSTTVTIDGEAPETHVDLVQPTDDGFYIVGRATDNHDVKHVLLTVRDDVTGKVLGANRQWQDQPHSFKVPIEPFGVWSWELPQFIVGATSGHYSFVAQAEDTAVRDQTRTNKQRWGNLDPTPVRRDVPPRQP